MCLSREHKIKNIVHKTLDICIYRSYNVESKGAQSRICCIDQQERRSVIWRSK